MLPGDEFKISCLYTSKYKTTPTYYGQGTNSEMCFGYVYFYPIENSPLSRCVDAGRWKTYWPVNAFNLNAWDIPLYLTEKMKNKGTNCHPDIDDKNEKKTIIMHKDIMQLKDVFNNEATFNDNKPLT
ncbi:hypothetical protein KUTeg_016909, partial [Tegillarca granosa]